MPEADQDAAAVQVPAPEQWLLILEPAPGSGVPMSVRMRRYVKAAGRGYGLKVALVCNNIPFPAQEPVEFSAEE